MFGENYNLLNTGKYDSFVNRFRLKPQKVKMIIIIILIIKKCINCCYYITSDMQWLHV